MNEYGMKFNAAYFDEEKNMLIQEQKFFKGQPFIVYRFCPSQSVLRNCIDIALAKMPYVMGYSQNLESRPTEKKLVQVFTGVLAETMTHIFLIEVCGIPPKNIYRYDLERKDFEYNADEEYDLKMVFGNNQSYIEVRNTRRHLNIDDYGECIGHDHSLYIIGPYLNDQKNQESINTLYARPILQETEKSNSPNNGLTADGLMTELQSGVSIFYITSGTDASHMYGKDGEYKNLGQKNTTYRVFSIEKAGDANLFANMVKAEYIKLCSESFLGTAGKVIPKASILESMLKH